MKRLIKKADATNLDQNYALDPNIVLNAIQMVGGSCTLETLTPDVNGRNAIWGCIDDSMNYVLEIYSFNNEKNAIVTANVSNLSDVSVEIKQGIRTEIKNNILTNGFTLQNGIKLTFGNQYTTIEQNEEEQSNQTTI